MTFFANFAFPAWENGSYAQPGNSVANFYSNMGQVITLSGSSPANF